MNSMVTVPRNAHRPKRAGSKARPPPPPSPSSRTTGPAGAPGRAATGGPRGARASKRSVAIVSVSRFHGQGGLVLHHVVGGCARVGVLVWPAMHFRDRPRPVAV